MQNAEGDDHRDRRADGAGWGHEPGAVSGQLREPGTGFGVEVPADQVRRDEVGDHRRGKIGQHPSTHCPDVGQGVLRRLGVGGVDTEVRGVGLDGLQQSFLGGQRRVSGRQPRRAGLHQVEAAATGRGSAAGGRVSAAAGEGNDPAGAGSLPRDPAAGRAAVGQQTTVTRAREQPSQAPGQRPPALGLAQAVRAEPGAAGTTPEHPPVDLPALVDTHRALIVMGQSHGGDRRRIKSTGLRDRGRHNLVVRHALSPQAIRWAPSQTP